MQCILCTYRVFYVGVCTCCALATPQEYKNTRIQKGSTQYSHTIEACVEADLLGTIHVLLNADVFYFGSLFCGTAPIDPLPIMAFPFYHTTALTLHLLHGQCNSPPCYISLPASSLCQCPYPRHMHHTIFPGPEIWENNTCTHPLKMVSMHCLQAILVPLLLRVPVSVHQRGGLYGLQPRS